MSTVKILGFGAVVRHLLQEFAPSRLLAPLEIFARGVPVGPFPVPVHPLSSLTPHEGPLLLCCSADEAKVLAQGQGSRDRIAVAEANLAVVDDLLAQGLFRREIVFVLTNPSEIIAEYLRKRTENPRIYAVGLGVDQLRYAHLLGGKTPLRLTGNHWDRPCPLIEAGDRTLLDRLHDRFQTQVRSEFVGFKPPVPSGSRAIRQILGALQRGARVALSGYAPELGTFLGGTYDAGRHEFSPLYPESGPLRDLVAEVTDRHRRTFVDLTTSHAQKRRSL